jgi:hypothetical protein
MTSTPLADRHAAAARRHAAWQQVLITNRAAASRNGANPAAAQTRRL